MYLGHVVGNSTVKPEHGKLEAVQDFSTPETKSQVCAFLGQTGCYQRFIPDYSRPFILQTDASDHGIGAVLSQVDLKGEEHPIAYFSRKVLPREERY